MRVISGGMLQGDLVAFLILVNVYLYGPTIRLIQLNDQFARAQTGLNRIFKLLDTPPAVSSADGAPEMPVITGNIRYDGVWFEYEPGQPVLKGISLDIQPGEMIAFVGGSGSGKTTMINLLSRHYDVTGGKITIDGHDLRDIDLMSLRRQIGVVLQESLLFHTSIRENLRYGRIGASDADIVAAATAANLHHVIEAFPDGYDTKIGEEGMSLSGGQRQRLALARAVAAKPAILVLDDPLSALDVDTEALVEKALRSVLTTTTALIVAHRPSTVQLADRVALMQDGRITAIGKHSELLATNDHYRYVISSLDAAGEMIS